MTTRRPSRSCCAPARSAPAGARRAASRADRARGTAAHRPSASWPRRRRAAPPRRAPARRRTRRRAGRLRHASSGSSRSAAGRARAGPWRPRPSRSARTRRRCARRPSIVSCGMMLTPVTELHRPGLRRDEARLEQRRVLRLIGKVGREPPRRPERVEHAVDDRGIAFRKHHDADVDGCAKHCIAVLGSNGTVATILPLTRNVQPVVCRALTAPRRLPNPKD